VHALGFLGGHVGACALTNKSCKRHRLIIKPGALATSRAVSASKHHGLVRVHALGLLALNRFAP
jgi:hypothetical protein